MTPRLIILGAGKPYSTQRVTLERRVLEWQIDAFSGLSPDIEFVGGYDIEEVMRQFPRLTYLYNENWKNTGAVQSLMLAFETKQSRDREIWITYSDILFRPEILKLLSVSNDFDVDIAIDYSTDLVGKTESMDGGEFIGLVRIPATRSQKFQDALLEYGSKYRGSRLYRLFSVLSEVLNINFLPVEGSWAHAEHERSVARFVLGTKASTLERLKRRLKCSSVLELEYFTRREWFSNPTRLAEKVIHQFKNYNALIVRSSASDEDGFQSVNAGKYHSELNVPLNPEVLRQAVEKVFSSYHNEDDCDEVLMQPQLSDVLLSGVAFTRVLYTGAPYRVVNYCESSDTTAITGGITEQNIKLCVARSASKDAISKIPKIGSAIVPVLDELEDCTSYDALDVEFAVTKEGSVKTLQVRPLMVRNLMRDRNKDVEIDEILHELETNLSLFESPPENQSGNRAIWSVMADWNPAEIIGLTPSPLALDLYRHVITDHTWAVQRKEVGYRNLVGWPLVRSFGGQAYVDVRASMNSFVPEDLPLQLAEKMINEGLDTLSNNPELHDKLEFDIFPTCCDFSSDSHVKKHYLAITKNIIGRAESDYRAVCSAEKDLHDRFFCENSTPDNLRLNLALAKQNALTFAHLARAGFVAVSFLNSAVAMDLIEETRKNELMASINTVSGMLTHAARNVKKGKMKREDVLLRFGHLRPGTYDILASTYRENPEVYLDPLFDVASEPNVMTFEWSAKEKARLNLALKNLGIGLDAEGMLKFARTAIEGREYAKFVFTRPLSQAIDAIKSLCSRLDLSDREIESVPLDILLTNEIEIWSRRSFSRYLKTSAAVRADLYELAGQILLPPVITKPTDIFAFSMPHSEPSFVTQNRIRAKLKILLEGEQLRPEEAVDSVIALVNADPGFDYLFGLGIKGLLTAFGGPNSHMAIRAAEFQIPAVIGIGMSSFDELRDNVIIEIDGLSRKWVCAF